MDVLSQSSGLTERQVAPSSGLLNHSFSQAVTSDGDCVIDGASVGGASSAAVTAWTNLTLTSNYPVCLGTLVAKVMQSSATTGTFQLRVTGYDQFGRQVVETTPIVTLAAKSNNFIYLAYVFAYVSKVEYKSTGLDVAGDTIDLGQLWDWTQTVDATNAQTAGDNLGLALPFEPGVVQTAQTGRVRYPTPYPQEAYGILRITGNPTAGQTVVIDGHTYTWRASVSTTADEVLLGASATEHAQNLAYAIMADSAHSTKFGSNTVKHTTVYVPQYPSSGVLTIWSIAKSSLSNRIATTETSSNAAFDDTTLINGRSANGEVRSITLHNLTDNASAGAVQALDGRKFEIGLCATGWSSPRAKWRLVKQADSSGWASGDAVVATVHMRPQLQRP